jgi:hypothetical protein
LALARLAAYIDGSWIRFFDQYLDPLQTGSYP